MKITVVVLTVLLYLNISVTISKPLEIDCSGFLVRSIPLIFDFFQPHNQKIKFYLTTRCTSKNELFKLTSDNSSYVYPDDFDVKKRTVFILHGFLGSGTDQWLTDLATAYVQWEDVNVIIADWEEFALTYNYVAAVRDTETVGVLIAKFIEKIWLDMSPTLPDYSWGPLHLMGHSLGAHVVGIISKAITALKTIKWKVERITGFDPAQPCYGSPNVNLRLEKNDAPFVDIIHTNGKKLLNGGLGVPDPSGHIDFYVNGGKDQTGCETFDVSIINSTICSHSRSYLVFIDSLKYSEDRTCVIQSIEWSRRFSTVPLDIDLEKDCKNRKCTELGIKAEDYHKKNISGSFFSVTGGNSPYCKIDDKSKEDLKLIIIAAKIDEERST